jgi:hypothetical protein
MSVPGWSSGVADLGAVQHVAAIVVVLDLGSQILHPLPRLIEVHLARHDSYSIANGCPQRADDADPT